MNAGNGKKRKVRSDKAANHTVIRDAFLKIIQGKKKAPTIEELCSATGLSHNTIKKHLKALEFSSIDNPFRILTSEIVHSIYETAISERPGAVGAQKLWMQMVEGWSEKAQVDITTGGEKIKQVIKIGDKVIEFE